MTPACRAGTPYRPQHTHVHVCSHTQRLHSMFKTAVRDGVQGRNAKGALLRGWNHVEGAGRCPLRRGQTPAGGRGRSRSPAAARQAACARGSKLHGDDKASLEGALPDSLPSGRAGTRPQREKLISATVRAAPSPCHHWVSRGVDAPEVAETRPLPPGMRVLVKRPELGSRYPKEVL